MKNKKKIGITVILFLALVLLFGILFVRCTDNRQTEQDSKTTIEIGNKEKSKQEEKPDGADSKAEEKNESAANETAPNISETVPETETSVGQHTHNYVKTTVNVHHDAVGHYENVCVKEAWVEEVPVYEEVAIPVCNVCKQEIVGETPAQHAKAHSYEGGGHHTEYVKKQTSTNSVLHPAEYEQRWIIDHAAWDEKAVIYKCNCGAVK